MLRTNFDMEEASNCVNFDKPLKQSQSGKITKHLVAKQGVTVIKSDWCAQKENWVIRKSMQAIYNLTQSLALVSFEISILPFEC